MLSRSNDGLIIFCENELIEREVLTMQALRTLLDDEDPHPDAYLTVYTHNTVSGVKQAKNRRLALLEQVAGFIAGGGVADKDKLIEDFVARHTPKMANPKARKVDEQIRKNVVTAFNLCPVNKHQQRQTYLRLLLAGNPTVTRPMLKSVHKGFGITCGEDAYKTARAAVKDANYVIGTLPEAPKQGRKTYETKDPTFQDRVESFWLSPEFTKPDPFGGEGKLCLTVPQIVVAQQIKKSGICGVTKACECIPDSVRKYRQASDICPICDDYRLLPLRKEKILERLMEKYSLPEIYANDLDAVADSEKVGVVEKEQIDRIDDAIALGEAHRGWVATQGNALSSDIDRAKIKENKSLVIIVDFKSNEEVMMGTDVDERGERNPDFHKRGKAGVFGSCVFGAFSAKPRFLCVVSDQPDHTAAAAQHALEAVLAQLELDGLLEDIEELCVYADCGPHFKAHSFVAFVTAGLPLAEIEKGSKRFCRNSFNLFIEYHGKSDVDRYFQTFRSLINAARMKKHTYSAGQIVEGLMKEVKKRDELFERNSDATFEQFLALERSFKIESSYPYLEWNMDKDFLLRFSHCYRTKVLEDGDVELVNCVFSDQLHQQTGKVIATSRKVVTPPKSRDGGEVFRKITHFKPERLRKKMERIHHDMVSVVPSPSPDAEGAPPPAPRPLPPAIPPLRQRILERCVMFPPGAQRTHASYWLSEVGRRVEFYTVEQGWRTGLILGETEKVAAGEAPGKGKAKGKGGKGQKKVGEGQFVRVRLFGVHGSEDIKAEVLQLLDMLLHPNEQLRTIFLHKVKPVEEEVAPILALTSEEQDPGTADIFVQCSLCKKYRIVPPPWCWFASDSDFVFTCSMKTGSGCDAAWDEAELQYYDEE